MSRARRFAARAALAIAALLPLAAAVRAHNLAPAYLELREGTAGAVDVRLKLPATRPRGAELRPELPCPDASPRTARLEGDAVVVAWRLACRGSLVGRRVAMRGLTGSGTDALLHVALADGRELRAVLSERAPALTMPARERALAVFADYARLGVAHLWTGLDHLLFAAGLTLLLGATRRLALAISAFTLGHSATLALAVLGVVRVPQALVEAAIAATLVALALDLAAPAKARAGGVARRPALLPFAFGLLHGLGFAGALGALGLPQQAIPLALFAFNVGIEVGQLAAIAVWVAAGAALLRLARSAPRSALEGVAATALGSLGVFWCLERASAWLFP